MRALRIGVIGLGDICHAYLSNLQKYPEAVELYACAGYRTLLYDGPSVPARAR